MPNEINTQDSPLFQSLSEQEQEIIYGGRSYSQYPFFLHLLKVSSSAKSQISFSDGSENTSINQESNYTSTELTIGMDSSFLGSGRGRRKNSSLNDFFSLLFWLLY
ncbi:hypothetical protein [Anabaena sp. UHCC 0451]|uniref:hypothetical protein n=1 Tax=Anabaena sp. UHCC 0451 TaxID=2055235 RepID=UPI002B212E6D|nr:hypothetical protein [Anabaena sp. UHCC 0451]MEA5576397.1 hypothetical protein [Anabaena sp. UHCC 0451]